MKNEASLTDNETQKLLNDWKNDSVGCLRLRDPEKMKIYARELIGKDSLELTERLGPPNYKYGKKGKRHFSYVLECIEKKTSYYNFYFHFDGDTIEWFSNPVH